MTTEDTIGDRLREMLDNAGRDRLRLGFAADLAVEQLDYLRSRSDIPRGALMIVIASSDHVGTLGLPPHPHRLHVLMSRADAAQDWLDGRREEMSEPARAVITALGALREKMPEPAREGTIALGAMYFLLDRYGVQPGEINTPDDATVALLLGLLLAEVPRPELLAVLTDVEHCIRGGICPVLVGLLAGGAMSRLDDCRAVWPLLVKLGPHASGTGQAA